MEVSTYGAGGGYATTYFPGNDPLDSRKAALKHLNPYLLAINVLLTCVQTDSRWKGGGY
tara:strand:- start:713 stop:889 length:177 start_codon:yes stop_codon:yes gene_type:complete